MLACFEKRDPARNQARFYRLGLTPTLFGDWALIREWGRIGRPGRRKTDYHPDQVAAEKMMARLVRRRQRHGYQARP